MKKLLPAFLTAIVCSALVGCHIENHDRSEPADPSDTCSSYCLRLYDCGSISSDLIGACLDQCSSRLRSDEERTVSACECVLEDECRAMSDYDCPGAPIVTSTPPPSGGGYAGNSSGTGGSAAQAGSSATSSSGGSTSSSGGSTSSSGGATSSSGGSTSSSGGSTSSSGGSTSSSGSSGSGSLSCEGGYDCAANEDCVDGACRQRCSASCQCPTDLSCVDHYCRSSQPPPMCTTDCECASGQHCLVGGVCG